MKESFKTQQYKAYMCLLFVFGALHIKAIKNGV